MPQVIVFLDKKENEIVEEYAKLIEGSKHDAIKEIIRVFNDMRNKND